MPSTWDHDASQFGLLDVLKRGTTIDIHAEDFWFVTSTEILDVDPDGDGGLVLTLAALIEEGTLEVTRAMIASATDEIRIGGLVFRFGLSEAGEPAFGPDGFFTNNPETLEEHRAFVRDREARRDAKRRQQEGQ